VLIDPEVERLPVSLDELKAGLEREQDRRESAEKAGVMLERKQAVSQDRYMQEVGRLRVSLDELKARLEREQERREGTEKAVVHAQA